MTKEQAIDLLDNLIGFVEDNHGSDYDEALKMAIKALERESCEDAISRQAVLEPYQTLKDSDTICIWLLRKNIEQQPPVTPQQRWIPVSERLPEIDTTNGFKASDVVLVCLVNRERHMAFYCDDTKWRFCESGEAKEPMWDKVIAWMPLPEPYKAENKTKQGLAYADQDTLIPAT